MMRNEIKKILIDYGVEGEEYSDLEEYLSELLTEVKRLREEKEILLEELKNDDTGIKAIDGLLKAVKDRNEEVKRLRGILGDIVDIDEWGGDGKDVGITITYGEGYTFTGWLDKVYENEVEE